MKLKKELGSFDDSESLEDELEEPEEEKSSNFSSDSSNEFWNVDPQLQARTLLAKGRIMYKKREDNGLN